MFLYFGYYKDFTESYVVEYKYENETVLYTGRSSLLSHTCKNSSIEKRYTMAFNLLCILCQEE